jgi:hypothetical protein
VPLTQLWTHWRLDWFFLSNPIFTICLNYWQENPLQNPYLPHLRSENCEINLIKSGLSRVHQEHQECFQISIYFSILILFYFHWENNLIINNFHTISQTISNQVDPPILIQSFLKYQESGMKHCGLGDLTMMNKTKQTTLLHYANPI